MSASSVASMEPSSSFLKDQHVDDADGAGIDQREQFLRHLAGEVARTGRELDDDVVDGAELIQRLARLD